MLTPEEIKQVKQWNPDEIARRSEGSLTFMWSPWAGLIVGWPMDHDPTRGNAPVKPGRPKFRPNHQELAMITPNFTEKFFGNDPQIMAQIKAQPHEERSLMDKYGLSGRVGYNIKIGNQPRTICGFWQSPNFEKYAPKVVKDCKNTLNLDDNAIIYPYQSEPMLIGDVLGGSMKLRGDECMGVATIALADGRKLSLGDIAAALHTQRGVELEKIKGPFCDQYQSIRHRCKESRCEQLLGLLDDVYERLGCDNMTWNKRANAGSEITRAEMRPTFANPDHYYRNKKELDKAWDAYLSLRSNRPNESVTFRDFFNHILTLEGNSYGTGNRSKVYSRTVA